MAGARLELNGASKSRIIVTEPEPEQHHVASLVQKAPAPLARAPKAPVMNLIFNIERNETISGAGAV
jgi:hypothetical protein